MHQIMTNYRLAIASLRHNRGRSYLTILGIMVGVASVIAITSIGQGVKRQVTEGGFLAKNAITITPNSQNGTASTSLTASDAEAVARADAVTASVPFANVSGTISSRETNNASVRVVAAGPDIEKVLHDVLGYGAFYSKSDRNASVAVIGRHVAEKVFGEEVPLGQSFTFRGKEFIVQGILHPFPSTPLAPNADLNNAVIIPYDTAKQIAGGDLPIYEIAVTSNDAAASSTAITKQLTENHGGQQDFIVNQQGAAGPTGHMYDSLTAAFVGIALLSLLVAGIGIMNVMLVSVTERLHEIGIRKAIGATNRQIMVQFMTEAAVLSVAGALVGIIVALILDGVLILFSPIQPVISLPVIGLSFAVALIVGLIFGTVPALKAARKDPIDALRLS